MTERKSAGGSANELGSLHRNGLAAVLASYGLSGAPIDGVDGAVPTSIALETDDDVDDIVCTMANGARWYIQAKRSTNDVSLRSALRQFAAQPVDDGDKLVLATRSVGGYLAGALRVLDSRRAGRVTPPPEKDREQFATFEKKVRDECGDNADKVLSHALIIEWAVDGVADERANSAAVRLERLTQPGSGHIAFQALQGFFQQQGAARTSTSHGAWLHALRSAGLQLSADGLGALAAQRDRERIALETYCEVTASCKDRLDLSVISRRVPEVTVDDFVSSIEVEFTGEETRKDSDPLTHIVRRNGRMLLRGLPGAGKSEAMRQLAAWLVTQHGAPLPLLIRLRDIASAVETVDDVSLELLLDAAARRGSIDASAPLVAALRSAVDSGHCILLLDGLDETYEKRSTIAAGVSNILKGLSTHVGIVITTRESAMDAAEPLGFPVADLKTSDNRRAQSALVRAYSVALAAPEHRDAWLTDKLAIVEHHAEAHREIWRVPLLSTLATVRILEGHKASDSVVDLLSKVIEDSVHQWEVRRSKGLTSAPDPGFNIRMFLDGFAALGRALNAGSTPSTSEARTLLTTSLGSWKLSGPATETIAEYVLKFWDDTVGVFVDTGGKVQPRSRLFAELGDAYALLRLDSDGARLAWLGDSLDTPSRANALALASGANLDIARWLISASTDESGHRRAQAATWLIEFAPSWSHLTPDDTNAVMTSLAAAARDQICIVTSSHGQGISAMFASATSWRDKADGCGWRFAAELARLPVPESQLGEKAALLADYPADADHRALLVALNEIASDPAAVRTDTDFITALEQALRYPLDEYHDDDASPDRFGTLTIENSNEPAPYGLGEVANRAASVGSELSAETIEHIWNIGVRLPAGQYQEIRAALKASGHQAPFDFDSQHTWASLLPRDDVELDWFVPRLVGELPAADEVHLTERWRKSSLADLVDLSNLREASYEEIAQANRIPTALTEMLLRAVIDCARLDEKAIQLQAHDMQTASSEEREDLALYLYTPRLTPFLSLDGTVSEETALDLIEFVKGSSEWSSNLARNILVQQSYSTVRDAAAAATAANWRSERNLAFVRLYNASSMMDEALELMSQGGGSRWVAAAFAAARDTETNEGLLATARSDDDATVRDAAAATLDEVLDANYWTCRLCFAQNDIKVYVCRRCKHSSKNSMKSHEKIQEYITALEADTKTETAGGS